MPGINAGNPVPVCELPSQTDAIMPVSFVASSNESASPDSRRVIDDLRIAAGVAIGVATMPVLALKGLANQAAESTPYKDTIAAFRAGFADGLVLKAVRHQSAPLELNTIFDPLSELEASLRFPKPSLKNVSRAMGNSALALVNGVMNVGLNGVKKIQNSRGSK